MFRCSRVGFFRDVSDFSQSTGSEFLEAEIQNKFLMATKVRVNRDRSLDGSIQNKQFSVLI